MRILQVVKTSEGAVWAARQAVSLKKRGYEIIAVCPGKVGKSVQMYLDNNIKVIEADVSLPVKKPWLFFNKISLIRKIINETAPDIIHLHFVTNVLMFRFALRKCKIPMVFQVPGPLHLESFLTKNIEIMTARKNDYWIGTCKKTCEIYLSSGIQKNHIFLGYYGGAGGSACDLYKNNINILHKEYNLSDNIKIIGMISYFYKPKILVGQRRGLKGHEDFIDALSIVCKKDPNVVGFIIGGVWDNSDKYAENVKLYAEKTIPGKIIFTGVRNDLYQIYKELSIAVHPSHSENLGGAAESLAAGVPTIATNVGGFPDIVINDKTGLLVPPKDPKKLSDAIIEMLENPDKAKNMAICGQKQVKKLLDIENCADNIEKIYQKIIEDQSINAV